MNNQSMDNEQDITMDLSRELEEQKTQADVENKYLTFYVDGKLYGLTIAVVTEIQQDLEPTPMPELPYYVKGIVSLRGNVLPILDLNLRFGKTEPPHTDRTCIIIVEVDDREVGVIVDQVYEVLALEDAYICPPPVFSGDEHSRFVIGVCQLEEAMLLILDPHKIMPDSELG